MYAHAYIHTKTHYLFRTKNQKKKNYMKIIRNNGIDYSTNDPSQLFYLDNRINVEFKIENVNNTFGVTLSLCVYALAKVNNENVSFIHFS